jgi:hypothetical protein
MSPRWGWVAFHIRTRAQTAHIDSADGENDNDHQGNTPLTTAFTDLCL